MEELTQIKGKSVTIPKIVNRFIIMYYDEASGWKAECNVYTTPESAIQNFMDRQTKYQNDRIKYYKCVEVELEIPFIPKSK